MSEDSKKPQQSEEIDLGQLFKLIGNAFERFFNFIGNICYKIFLAFVWGVFFVKRHILKIAIAAVIGFAFGFYKEIKGKPIYKSTTVIKQNYDTGENLYRAIDYYNELIQDKDSITLGAFLGIEPEKAASIINLEVESVITYNEKLKNFDEYTKELDSTIAKTMTFEDYVKNSKEFQYPVQRITIRAREKGVFGVVISQIINKTSNTGYFIDEQKKDLEELSRLKQALEESIKESKELQNVYKNVLEKPNQNQGSQTSIRIDNTEDKNMTKEYDLYLNDINLKRELVGIERQVLDKSRIIEIVSSQENQGTIDNSKKLFGSFVGFKFYYAIVLALLTSAVLLLFHFIRFLEKYRAKI